MKLNVIFDATGNIVGTWTHNYSQGETFISESDSNLSFGIQGNPGQTVQEVEVPDELLSLEAADFMQQLANTESVKNALRNLATAGDENQPNPSFMPSQTSLANPAGTITFGAVETQFNASPIFSDGAANTMLTTGITSGQL